MPQSATLLAEEKIKSGEWKMDSTLGDEFLVQRMGGNTYTLDAAVRLASGMAGSGKVGIYRLFAVVETPAVSRVAENNKDEKHGET